MFDFGKDEEAQESRPAPVQVRLLSVKTCQKRPSKQGKETWDIRKRDLLTLAYLY
jgi:hypothetical protein